MLATAAALLAAPAGASPPASQACDIDGDGRSDLVVGAPLEDVAGDRDAGALQVLFGAGRLRPRGDDLWHQGERGVAGRPGRGDELGGAVACGDFDADGFDDVAAGAEGEVVGSDRAGAVLVLYGSNDGVTRRTDLWHQDGKGVKGAAEDGDRFGAAVVAGDFDRDGRDDLAVGVPGEGAGGARGAGAVHVLYGSRRGLSARDDLWHQADKGIRGAAERNDAFGSAVASGDFDRDGRDDLAAGVPGEGVGRDPGAGAVHVLYGGRRGLSRRDALWHQARDRVKGATAPYDTFGFSVSSGDFDGDGVDDLAVGVVGESVGGHDQAGAVHALYGDAGAGLGARDQLWHQDDRGVSGSAGWADGFGAAIAAGDFDRDGRDDLAVGVPGETVGGHDHAGAVQVLYGGRRGLGRRDLLRDQDDPGVGGSAETGDVFGRDLAAADFDGDGADDLAVGVAGEDAGGVPRAGAVQTFFGGATGLTTAGRLWHQDDAWVAGGAEAGDMLASAVSGARTRPLVTVAYQLRRRGDVESGMGTFRRRATDTLRNHRGWALSGAVEFLPARSSAELRLWLADPQAVESAAPGCSASWSCRVGDDVYINEERWQHSTDTYDNRSLRSYRHYVVNHEVGHWLGLGHAGCRRRGAPAPVMQQQSKSLDGCRARVWPLPRELAAARQGLAGVDEEP